MKISVIGVGHVGLIAGVCFAEIGHDVLCVDNDESKLDILRRGEAPFFEPRVEELLRRGLQSGRLRFSGELRDAAEHAAVIFLCVGTPPLPDGQADLSAIERVTRGIAVQSSGYKLIVEKSTVPVQTGDRITKTLEICGARTSEVASNPEFLAEGTAVNDFLFPDRVVLGVESERAGRLLREIYRPILRRSFEWRPESPDTDDRPPARLVVTNRSTAEIIKHASNSFLATKISYINMVARLCERVGADVSMVSEGMGLDRRIGSSFLRSGLGFGGFCFPKDLQSFVRMAESSGCDFSLLREVERINRGQIDWLLQKLKDAVWVLPGKNIAVWGLAFKPHTDDTRFSPAVTIVRTLLQEGARVQAYDPQAMHEARQQLEGLQTASSALDAVRDADALLILTDWPEFADADWTRVGKAMRRRLVLDGRNHLDARTLAAAGFEYVSLGRSAFPSMTQHARIAVRLPAA